MTHGAASPHVTCPACGHDSSLSTEVPFSQRTRGIAIWRSCSKCKSFFNPESYDPQKEVSHTQATPWGRPDSGKELSKYKTRLYRSVLELLKKHCPPPARLLDAGCSFGGFLIEARTVGYSVSGFDIVPGAVEYVRSLSIPAEVSFSIENLDLNAESGVDIVSCLDCNCYWPDQPAELRGIFAQLKPGGYLAMRVADKSWMFRLGLAAHRLVPSLGERLLKISVNDHKFSMPVPSLLRVIRNCGFDMIYASPGGAIYSERTRWSVKASFLLGSLAWQVAGVHIAPGALILARKPLDSKSLGRH